MKFGETSFADVQITRDEIVSVKEAASRESVVVVASAMTGITEQLTTIAKHHSAHNQETIAEMLEMIADRHRDVVEAVLPDDAYRLRTADELEFLMQTLSSFLRTAEKPLRPWEHDLVVTFGSRLSALIFARILQAEGVTSRCIFSSDCIVVDEFAGEQHIDEYESRRMMRRVIEPLLEQEIVPVVTGSFAGTPDGRIVRIDQSEVEAVLKPAEQAVSHLDFNHAVLTRI